MQHKQHKQKISFSEFSDALAAGDSRSVDLNTFVEMDPDAPVPRLRFRSDALIDDVPDDFDVDEQVHQYVQRLDKERFETETRHTAIGTRAIVGEGDSWMNLPGPLGWRAIGDSIYARGNFPIRNIGKWGHTLAEMLAAKEYMAALESYAPSYFVFSGGGNDLQDRLAAGGVIKQYDPALDPRDYLTEDGDRILSGIGDAYRHLLTEITDAFPTLKIFTHSYDYPRPLVGRGKFLGRHLRDRDIPDELMTPILKHVLEQLDSAIGDATSMFASVTHVRSFGVTEGFSWRDDFHPKNDGFDAVATAIETAINQS